MSGTQNIPALPPPVFVTDADGLDPNLILADQVTTFQTASGRTLYPAQPERLLINQATYREALVRNQVQLAALQNLVAFASYPVLDYLGALVATPRLAAQPAITTLLFTLIAAQNVSVTIAAGTQIGTIDGAWVFATNAALVIPAGQTSASVGATCTVTGPGANGYLPGQVSVVLGGNPLLASVANTGTTAGGAIPETDAHYRVRIQAAPNQFSVAGPFGAYRYWALSADPTIEEVYIVQPVPGTVAIYVLTGPIIVQPAASPNSVGIAATAIIDEVINIVSADTVRPLCDTVEVFAVTEVDYTIAATITGFSTTNIPQMASAAMKAGVELALNLASGIQNDIVPSQWVAAFSVNGVYEVIVSIAATIASTPVTPQSDGRIVLTTGQWTNCTGISIGIQSTLAVGLLDDAGVLALVSSSGWPTSQIGLAPGSLWSNGGVVSVAPGAAPSPTAPGVFFGLITSTALLALGGANLPTAAPPAGSGQIWNNGGECWVA